MRFIHIADLHLGKKLKEFSLIDDQRAVLCQVTEAVKKHKPDAVFIAGDVYDRMIPPAEAVALFDEFLSSLAELDVQVFVISGNHDSPERLAFGSALMDRSGVHISPVYDGRLSKHTVTDEFGEVDVYMLPFVRPATVRHFFEDTKIENYTDAVRAAIRAADIDFENRRNVLISHQFVTGGVTCDSEVLSVGGLENVDGSVYEGFDYVALGHLHGLQSVGSDRISYSGTPLKYSLSEQKHKKRMIVGEIGADGELTLKYEEFSPIRDLREIENEFDEIIKNPSEDYVHIILTDELRVPQAGSKLRVYFPNLISWDQVRRGGQAGIVPDIKAHKDRSPEEVFSELFRQINGKEMAPEQTEIISTLSEKIWREQL
ncbi:exonuclease SbcCD subunit D [Ruminococcus sp. NK3A76]|uniref:exonuclease SbcCD subunit D n=1 Tax=Ruminococcus sp. NK3A76 TaxID=877411 RepID=UPI000491B41E|nr:exonuclease SbcCD subunit D [Ruminococcus sp. NK3A76]